MKYAPTRASCVGSQLTTQADADRRSVFMNGFNSWVSVYVSVACVRMCVCVRMHRSSTNKLGSRTQNMRVHMRAVQMLIHVEGLYVPYVGPTFPTRLAEVAGGTARVCVRCLLLNTPHPAREQP